MRQARLEHMFFRLIVSVRRLWHADTQSVEGLNNVVKCITSRAPRIQLSLLASRLSLSKRIHENAINMKARERLQVALQDVQTHYKTQAFEWLETQKEKWLPLTHGLIESVIILVCC